MAGFLLLMAHAFLKASVTNKFELSLGFIGPTEARITGAGFSVLLFFTGNPLVLVFAITGNSYPFTFMDILGTLAAAAVWALLAANVIKTARMLDREDMKAIRK